MEISSIFFDADLDYLEQHQIETLLQILKDKYGKGTRIKATGDSSFEYICSCPVHKDGLNPNGRGLLSLKMGIFASTVMVLAALRKKTPGSLGHFWSG